MILIFVGYSDYVSHHRNYGALYTGIGVELILIDIFLCTLRNVSYI